MIKPSVSKKYLSPWNLLYFVLGLLLLWFLLRQVDFASLIQLILKIKGEYLILGGVIYLCKAGMRSFRFSRINDNEQGPAGFLRMLRLSLATSLASQLLPLKLGELSYVYLLKKDSRAPISRGVSTLMVIRIFDLLAIALLFIGISLFSRQPQGLSIYFYSILGFVAFLLVLILTLLVVSRSGRAVLKFFFQFAWVQKIPFSQKIRGMLEGIFDDLVQFRWSQYLEWTGIALLEWGINYATYHVILWGIGLQPSFFDTVVGVTFAALASVLPVNSFGNFGTQEAGWATGLVLLNYPQDIALTSGFATHLLTLAYMLLFGGLAWLSYLVQPDEAVVTEQVQK